MNIKYKTERQRQKARTKQITSYHKKTMTPYTIRFHNEHDKEVINKLNSVENRTDYIRQLILQDIKKGQ